MKKIYGEFSKVEEMNDGTLKVWGYASSETKDAEGEIITAAAMKAAIPDYMKFGAVREMHKASAAGTAIEIEVQDDGRTFFGCHVVDSEAVKKVKNNVYKGFSIGGGIPKDGRDPLNKSIVNKINLIEISLVDRPCNPEAVFTMYKAEGVDEESLNENAEKVEKAPTIDKNGSTSEADQTIGKAGTTTETEEDLEKARFSQKTKETLAYVHKVMKDCCDKLGGLGYDVEVTVKSDTGDNEGEEMGKLHKDLEDTLAKVKLLVDENELLKLSVKELADEVKLLKSQPETPKGALKVVEKSADVVVDEKSEKSEPIPEEGTMARAEYEMKKVFNASGSRFA